MRLGLAIEGRLAEVLETEAQGIGLALHRAAVEAADVVKRDWRRAVMSAGLGQRVANTIRSNTYPPRAERVGRKRDRVTLSPATMVFSRAPHILTGHAGATIVPQGSYLPVPTEFTPLSRKPGRGRTGQPMRLEEFLETFGRNSLGRAPLANGNIALVARRGFAVSRTKRRSRGLGRELAASRRGEKALIMYVLVKSVKLPARLDLDAMYARAERHWPRIVRAALARVLSAEGSPPGPVPMSGFASAGGAGGFSAFAGASGFGQAA